MKAVEGGEQVGDWRFAPSASSATKNFPTAPDVCLSSAMRSHFQYPTNPRAISYEVDEVDGPPVSLIRRPARVDRINFAS